MAELVDIDAVRASDYNPRANDEKRLELTELSLRKLGFLLPIYAEANGEILSGHQRQLVARRMGYKKIPVQYVHAMSLEQRKTVNITFNRATNDLHKQDSCENLKEKLYSADIDTMADELPDIEPNTKEAYPCIYAVKRVDTLKLAKNNHQKFDSHILACARNLCKETGDLMNLVISEDLNVINGIGRLQYAVEKKEKFVKCVQVSKAQEELSNVMLNMLSMDFSIGSAYADVLRYNSHMRARNTRETDAEGNCALGNGFYKGLFPNSTGRDFFKLEGAPRDEWIAKYGDKIVDFGAGKLNNTRTLRDAGIYVSAFEPYFVGANDTIHPAKSREIANQFLDEVESGVRYTSVFISSVYNSVPFMADRIKIAYIAAALCYPAGKVVCWCQSDKSAQFSVYNTHRHRIARNSETGFRLDYEPNTVLADIGKKPKVQKGHTEAEIRDIFNRCFKHIDRAEIISNFWYLEASGPMLDLDKLAEAIDFEFNLPYPDGTRMGLVDRAREAFEKRLGLKLPKVEENENG